MMRATSVERFANWPFSNWWEHIKSLPSFNGKKCLKEYADTPGVYDKAIVNDDLERAYVEFAEFVYQEALDEKSETR
jgi:hypothetical protein